MNYIRIYIKFQFLKHGLIWLSVTLLFVQSLCGYAHGQLYKSDKSYLVVKKPGFVFGGEPFSPLLMSGDGRVLYGYNAIGLEKWTFSSGIEIVEKFPVSYGFLLKSSSFSGTSIFGIFADGHLPRQDSGIFIWSSRGGLRMVSSNHLIPDKGEILPPFYVNDSGDNVSFGCQYCFTKASNDTPSADLQGASYGTAFWNTFSLPKASRILSRYNFSFASGDSRHFLIGDIGSSNFKLADSHGIGPELQDFPRNFSPAVDKVLMNQNGTIVAIQDRITGSMIAWDSRGRRQPDLKLPKNCVGFWISAIDTEGAFFGSSYCSTGILKSFSNVGLRVTKNGGEEINEWLRNNGLPNDFGQTAIVQLVSDDGKTVFGKVPYPTVEVGGAEGVKPRNTPSETVSRGLSEQPNENPLEFIAHIN